MQLEKALLAPKHLQKEQTVQIAKAAALSKKAFGQLVQLASSSNSVLCIRAAWCLNLAAKIRPDRPDEYQRQLVELLYIQDPPDGLLRNILSVFRDCKIHADLYDRVAYICFEFVQDTHKAIAIRAAALYVLGQIAAAIPELRPEIKAIIEFHFENKGPGLNTASVKVLSSWSKSGPAGC